MSLTEQFKAVPAMQARQEIPEDKRAIQRAKTGIGAVLFLAGFLIPHFLGFPWQVGAIVSAFGAWITSQQLVTDFLKAVVQFVPQILAAMGGKAPPTDPPATS